MKKYKYSFMKTIVPIVLSLAIGVGTMFGFAGCAQQNDPPTNDDVINSDTTNDSVGDKEEKKEEVLAGEIYNNAFKEVDFAQNLSNGIYNVMYANDIPFGAIRDVKIAEVTYDEKGTFVFTFKRYNWEKEKYEPSELRFNGDTRPFEKFMLMSNNSQAMIDVIFNANGVTKTTMVEKNGEVYNALVEDFAELRSEYESSFNAFKTMDCSTSTTIDPQPPVVEKEYVSVQSIVDSTFADINVDKDLREILSHAVYNRYPSEPVIIKLYAMSIDETGKITFTVEDRLQGLNNTLCNYHLQFNNDEHEIFLGFVKDMNGAISQHLQTQGINISSEVEKNSAEETNLKSELLKLKQKYLSQKETGFELPAENITANGLFGIADISSVKNYINLGSPDMKEFAYALDTNTNGQGYENVTGWSSEDVLGCYVNFGTSSWDGTTGGRGVDYAVVTKQGVFQYFVVTRSSKPINYLGAVLNDTKEVVKIRLEKEYKYSGDVIIYDENGERANQSSVNEQIYEQ